MKRIPLHSLVILIGPAMGGKSTWAAQKFPLYEIISSEGVRFELIGDRCRFDINDVVFREIHRRITLKLEMGERVVVDATNLRKKDRTSLAEIGIKFSIPVFYLVCNQDIKHKTGNAIMSWRSDPVSVIVKHEQIFKMNERDILRGDGLANVIDTRQEDFEVVTKMPYTDLLQDIEARGYRGLMVIGDVHGMIEPLKNATEWATARNLFCVLLGDIVDYGPNSLECIDHVYEVVTRGRGICVIGNHERKIERWIEQVRYNDVRLRLSDGNKVTTKAIEALPNEARRKFESKYRAFLSFCRHHWVIGDTLFVHGGAEPEMFEIKTPRLVGRLESIALFGEVDNTSPLRSDGYPNRVYGWIDRVPAGKKVMVGHDIRRTVKPYEAVGKQGGIVYFMDTGSGKGGRLTSADILFEGEHLSVKNFKYH